jgi:hypothetical protein
MNNNGIDLNEFCRLLQDKLALIGQESLRKELQDWSETAFTTSSELLGEMKLILKKVYRVKNLDKETKKSVQDNIKTINKALRLW